MSRKPAIPLPVVDLGLVIAVILSRILSASRYLHKWDSVQFALGLSDFDVSRHQPHPPGYPGYIALGWLAKLIVGDDNTALVIVGVVSAAIIAVAMNHLGRSLLGVRGGIAAGILATFNPLLWYFSSIALAYMSGVATATLAVWTAFSLKGKARWVAPVIAGLSSVCWLPAGILVFPVCLWLILRREQSEAVETKVEKPSAALLLAGFAALFILPLIVGYGPVIADTGGLGTFTDVVRSESGKHVLRFENWMRTPLSEFVDNTGQLAGFFKQGLGLGRWLLLLLLITLPGESGLNWKKVLALLPLMVIGFVALHWMGSPAVRTLGILACSTSIGYLLPMPATVEGGLRRDLLAWWLIPGLLLFILVHVNYVGILIIFLPPLLLMVAWCIERFATFMVLQTIREPHEMPVREDGSQDEESGKAVEIRAKGPDMRVERMVAAVLITLMAIHDLGSFTNPGPKLSPISNPGSGVQENWEGILLNDKYFSDVIDAIDSCGVPRKDLIILGGEYNYRHWTYYLPEAETIWTKYLLYYPIREGRGIWVSRNRHQDQVIPETRVSSPDEDSLEARLPIGDAKGIVVFPEEWKSFIVSGEVIPLDGNVDEALCYLVKPGSAMTIVFSDGVFRLE